VSDSAGPVFLKRLRRQLSGGSLRAQLLRGGLGSVLIKVGNAVLGLTAAVVLARILGPREYGVYAYVFSLVSVLSIPAQFGLPQLLVRETARAEAEEQWTLMRGLWRWSTGAALSLSLVMAAAAALAAWAVSGRFSSDQLSTLAWGLALMPIVTLGKLRDAALRGLRRVIQGQLADAIVRPAVLIALVLFAVSGGYEVNSEQAMLLHVAAAASAFAVGAWLLHQATRPVPSKASPPDYETRRWLASVWPLAFIGGMQIVNKHSSILMLGLFAPSEDVGVYRAVMQAALAVSVGLQAMNMVVAPHFAQLYATGDLARLQRLVRTGARLVLAVTVPVVGVLLAFGQAILEAVFGQEFSAGYSALAILASGQLISATFGSVAYILNMTGHERDTARGVSVAAAGNIVFGILLIPTFGMPGAAAATAMSLTIWNILLYRKVKERTGLRSWAFFRG